MGQRRNVGEIRKYLAVGENKNTTYQNSGGRVNACTDGNL